MAALEKVPATVPVDDLRVAEREMVELGRTHGPLDLRKAGVQVRNRLDTDGPEPDERKAYDRESLTLKATDQGVDFRGYLANENAELLRALIHAHAKPHKTIDGAPDPRPRSKRQADALTTLLTTANNPTATATAPTSSASTAADGAGAAGSADTGAAADDLAGIAARDIHRHRPGGCGGSRCGSRAVDRDRWRRDRWHGWCGTGQWVHSRAWPEGAHHRHHRLQRPQSRHRRQTRPPDLRRRPVRGHHPTTGLRRADPAHRARLGLPTPRRRHHHPTRHRPDPQRPHHPRQRLRLLRRPTDLLRRPPRRPLDRRRRHQTHQPRPAVQTLSPRPARRPLDHPDHPRRRPRHPPHLGHPRPGPPRQIPTTNHHPQHQPRPRATTAGATTAGSTMGSSTTGGAAGATIPGGRGGGSARAWPRDTDPPWITPEDAARLNPWGDASDERPSRTQQRPPAADLNPWGDAPDDAQPYPAVHRADSTLGRRPYAPSRSGPPAGLTWGDAPPTSDPLAARRSHPSLTSIPGATAPVTVLPALPSSPLMPASTRGATPRPQPATVPTTSGATVSTTSPMPGRNATRPTHGSPQTPVSRADTASPRSGDQHTVRPAPR